MNNLDNAIFLPSEEERKLYHYTSSYGLKGICEGKFWATERNFLNDKTEFHVASDVFCEVLNKHIKNKKICSKLQEKTIEQVEGLQSTGLSVNDEVAYTGKYIISFSLDYDSPLMWSTYSNYFGYCIQFDLQKLLNSFNQLYEHQFIYDKVIYNHDEQIQTIEKIIEDEYFSNNYFDYINSWNDFDNLTEEEIEKLYFHLALNVSLYNMFFKLPCFEGEHEYRVVFMVGHDGVRLKENQKWKSNFRIKDEVLIPYIEVELKSLDSLEKVLIGSKNQSDIAMNGVKYFFRNLKHDVIVEKSQFPLRY